MLHAPLEYIGQAAHDNDQALDWRCSGDARAADLRRLMTNRVCALVAMLSVAACLMACDRADKRQSSTTVRDNEQKCLDQPCPGEEYPKHQPLNERATKVNGQWFVGPAEYGVTANQMAFLWPSKTPARAADAEQRAPEFRASKPGQSSNFYDVGIEVFFRSRQRLGTIPERYDPIREAEQAGRVLSKRTLRKGLDVWQVRDPVYPDPVSWYVATDLQLPDGKPAILFCGDSKRSELPRCTTGFFWQTDIAVDMRFAARHAEDWPEILQETVRVLQLLRKS